MVTSSSEKNKMVTAIWPKLRLQNASPQTMVLSCTVVNNQVTAKPNDIPIAPCILLSPDITYFIYNSPGNMSNSTSFGNLKLLKEPL